MSKYYPIMLDIQNKNCVVVGGGKVAERKILSLLEYGARVTVISPQLTPTLRTLKEENKINVIQRTYQPGDFKNYYLAYVATDDYYTNEMCFYEAKKKEILINVVDKLDMCDFIVPASIRRGDLTIAISTNGKSPMLSRKIREDLEESFSNIYEVYLNGLGELREIVLRDVKDAKKRRQIFKKIIYSDLLDRVVTGEITDIREAIWEIYKEFL